MHSREIRDGFLKYFERNGHRIVQSSSLVPHDDPSLLFTNAGMNQFKDVFLGKETREYKRAASSQKCMRVSGKHNDLDNVGPSLRHHTFFEMLGNFSFGDYFKKEAIPYAWELLTTVWKLPGDRLYPTIFKGESGIPRDDDARAVWRTVVPADRITELGLAENFWAMGETGPCGRCSEIHYFRGNDVPCPEPVCRGLDCSCDRFVEVWNNVFMEFDRQPDGALKPLPALSVDTGMGLERICAVLQEKISNYDTDLFTPLLAAIGDRAGRRYRATLDDPADISMRVVADHTRAMTFLIADGVVPSNEWRGYVLRKIMRRAMRHGKKLGITVPFLHTLLDVLTREMGDAYPELRRNGDSVVQVVKSEEERFDAVLTAGLPRLESAIERALASHAPVIPGDEIFRLYDSLGMPLDFIEDIAAQRGVGLDREGYERAMEGQREKARAGSAFEAKKVVEFEYASDAAKTTALAPGDHFEGYIATKTTGVPVVALFDGNRKQVPALDAGAEGFAVLEKTPFYLEAGGQVSDSGRIYSETSDASAVVHGLTRLAAGGPRAHRVRVERGTLRERDLVTAEVDEPTRDATRRNHTATHLLHAALRQVLGGHVKQAGSLVAPDRLRFDFVHFAPIGRAELDRIERIVNEQISRNTPVQTAVRDTQEAIAGGAMALFGEKYGDRVRVVTIQGFSVELCGGTHCRATGDIGFFVITQESGVAAGVRRIEALTGEGAVRYYEERRDALAGILDALGAPADQAADAVRRLQAEAKRLQRENEQLKMKAALGGGGVGSGSATSITEKGVVGKLVSGIEKGGLRSLAENLRNQSSSSVAFVVSAGDERLDAVVSTAKEVAAVVDASDFLKNSGQYLGLAGGGRSDFAQAGGRPQKPADAILKEGVKLLSRRLIGHSFDFYPKIGEPEGPHRVIMRRRFEGGEQKEVARGEGADDLMALHNLILTLNTGIGTNEDLESAWEIYSITHRNEKGTDPTPIS